MVRWADLELTGWGRVLRARTAVARPERVSELAHAVNAARDSSLLAFGAGRSYGDAPLNGGGCTVDMSRLDRLLALDESEARLVAEAGVTFGDAMEQLLPRGFALPVVPGTGYATLGGGIANDVHGKNHHQAGSFGHCVEWFDLRLPSGEVQRIEPQKQAQLFNATLGGVGLTGIVERLCVRLERVPSNAVVVRRRRVRDLDEHLAALAEEQDRSRYVVGWIDALATGRQLGRGILEAASLSPSGVDVRPRHTKTVPLDFPALALSPPTVRLFNTLYYGRVPAAGRESVEPYAKFLFPLDALNRWNRIYGKRGFHQFQCVVPFDPEARALRQLLHTIGRARQGSFLAVLKSMGPSGTGYLSFARPGHTLALDFPNAPGATELIGRLQRIAAEHGGRVYLAKDSTLSPTLMRVMYPDLPAFQAVRDTIDPTRRMQSDLARRLEI